MAFGQLIRGAVEAPWPQASWFSVARRSLVVAGFLVFGLLTDRLDTAVFASFGALQIALVEAALPLRALLRMMAMSLVAMVGIAFVAMSAGGTGWTVALLAVVAFLHGATAQVGPIPRAVGIGALAMGVIFAGIDADPALAATWLAIGAAVQSLSWLVFWHRERALSIRILLSNTIRSARRIATSAHPTGADNNAASAEIDVAIGTVESSGVPDRGAAVRVAGAVNEVRRNLIAWRQLEQPGLAERLRVSRRLSVSVRQLTESPGRTSAADACAGPNVWPVGRHLDTTITELESAIGQLATPDDRPSTVPSTSVWQAWRGLTPGSPDFRHGLRMALAIAVAQSLALVLRIDHAFWIPLTCVFVVKADWAFTLIRSLARIGGNLLAVLLVPAVVFVLGSESVGSAIAVLLISAIAFRYFTGNYILGSFGIAGTILVLDHLLLPDPALYVSRILSTVIGAVVGIAAVAVLPSWRSGQAVRCVDDTVVGLAAWSKAVTQAVMYPTMIDPDELTRLGEVERNNLIQLRPAVAAAVLEPRPVADPRKLAVIADAAARAHLNLLALTFEARMRRSTASPGLDIAQQAQAIQEDFDQAVALTGVESGVSSTHDGPPPRPPRRPQELAIQMEAVRLQQAAEDVLAGVTWLKRDGSRSAQV